MQVNINSIFENPEVCLSFYLFNSDVFIIWPCSNKLEKFRKQSDGRAWVAFLCFVPAKTGTQPFNRAMLFNVGFKEAMKDGVWDCVIFHDVDHLPENDRNYYGCGEMPRHFAAKLDKYMYM